MNQSRRRALRLATGVLIAATLLLLAVPGCAPTMLVNVWHDPSIARPQLNKILVISLRKDATRRRMWEDAFAMELSKYGVAATQSYRLCPGGAPDTSQMRECINKGSFDGVLTIAPLAPNIEKDYVPGYWTTGPYWFTPYWDRYYRSWWYYQQPGYVETYTLTRNEIDVYMVHNEGEAMVWSGTSDQTEPATMEEVRSSIVAQVTTKLAKQGIIPARE